MNAQILTAGSTSAAPPHVAYWEEASGRWVLDSDGGRAVMQQSLRWAPAGETWEVRCMRVDLTQADVERIQRDQDGYLLDADLPYCNPGPV